MKQFRKWLGLRNEVQNFQWIYLVTILTICLLAYKHAADTVVILIVHFLSIYAFLYLRENVDRPVLRGVFILLTIAFWGLGVILPLFSGIMISFAVMVGATIILLIIFYIWNVLPEEEYFQRRQALRGRSNIKMVMTIILVLGFLLTTMISTFGWGWKVGIIATIFFIEPQMNKFEEEGYSLNSLITDDRPRI